MWKLGKINRLNRKTTMVVRISIKSGNLKVFFHHLILTFRMLPLRGTKWILTINELRQRKLQKKKQGIYLYFSL